MAFAAVDFLVNDDAVETFLGRFGNQFFGQRNVFLGGETEAVNDALVRFPRLRFACKFRLPVRGSARGPCPSAQIHANGVIENIEACLFIFLLFRFGLLDPIHFSGSTISISRLRSLI